MASIDSKMPAVEQRPSPIDAVRTGETSERCRSREVAEDTVRLETCVCNHCIVLVANFGRLEEEEEEEVKREKKCSL